MAEARASSVVWTGRGRRGLSSGQDGWNTSPERLGSLIDAASEVVIHDPLSFPWPVLNRDRRRAVPLTVTLPPELSAQALASALHRPLLAQLTSFDRLIDLRKDVRALLTARYDLAEEVWESPSDDDGRRVGKTRLYNVVDDVQESVRRAVRLRESQPLVGFLGRAGRIAGPVATPLECMIGRFGLEPTPSDGPSPDTMVAWLPDGGQSRDDRLAELARARDLLHPGGALIVLGHVVTAGDGSENPSISTLVEDLASVFGGMLHVDDLRSIRWPGETLSRGVLVTATSLRGGIV